MIFLKKTLPSTQNFNFTLRKLPVDLMNLESTSKDAESLLTKESCITLTYLRVSIFHPTTITNFFLIQRNPLYVNCSSEFLSLTLNQSIIVMYNCQIVVNLFRNGT